jgi:hypothetical protein
MVTSISLVYLLYYFLAYLFEALDYLFSASWPSTQFRFGWYLTLLPCAIALYLIHISHLKKSKSFVLAPDRGALDYAKLRTQGAARRFQFIGQVPEQSKLA